MTRQLFEQFIDDQLANTTDDYIDLIAREVHRAVGGYPPEPGKHHRMPACCRAMRNKMGSGDEVVSEPLKGRSSSLTIRYYNRGR